MKQPPKFLRVLIPSILIAIWFGLAGIGGPYFGRIDEVSDIDLTAFLPKSAEATRVSEESKKFRDQKILPAIMVFDAKDGLIDVSDKAEIDGLSWKLSNVEGVTGEVSPAIVSEDKQAAFITVPIDSESEIKEVLAEVKTKINEADIDNVSYYSTGPAGFSTDLNKAFAGIDGLLLGVALAVVFVILLLVYRAPLLPILVLLSAVFALAVSILIVWQLANKDIIRLNGQVQGILFILVIGAATDYSLLYVARFREELHKQKKTWAATIGAIRGSIEPIAASGGTVIVGLLCLLFSDLASNRALGPVGSIGILMAVLAALTLLPALLLVFGRISFWPFMPRYESKWTKLTDSGQKGVWAKVGRFVAAYPRRIWVITTIALLLAASGIFQLKADGVAQSDLILGYSEAREGQKILSEHFPDGSGSPALAILPADRLNEFVRTYENDKGVDSVSVIAVNSPSGSLPLGKAEAEIKDDIRASVREEFNNNQAGFAARAEKYAALYGPEVARQFIALTQSTTPDFEAIVKEAYPFRDARPKVVDGKVLMQITLKDAPDSTAAEQTIVRIREASKALDSGALVGGVTAASLDTNKASIRDRAVIIPLVLVAITLILMVLLRSILAPILLLLTTVISFGTTLGVAALLFNTLFGFPGADPSVVLYAFVFLVALGIDYNIFLMTRVREESLKVGTDKGVIKGLIVTGGVITSAGVVLAATFAALAVLPIIFLVQLAFIVSFGVLLDTLIVRSLLVPALIKDIGANVWWPSKLIKKP